MNIGDYIPELVSRGVVTIPNFLREDTQRRLLKELERYPMQRADPVTGPFGVSQNFTFKATFPSSSLFLVLTAQMEKFLGSAFCELSTEYFCEPLTFNDYRVQRYQPCEEGVSPHLDGVGKLNLIVVLILEGSGEFCLCDTREGDNPRQVRNESGDLLIMPGNGFLGEDRRPFHFVGKITKRRTTFSLRHQKRNVQTASDR